MKLPKILHIINGLDVGGAEMLLFEICKQLHGAEFDMYVCALTGGKLKAKFHAAEIPFTVLGQKKYSLHSLILLKRLMNTFDPVLIHTHLFHAGILGRCLVRSGRSKIISTEHNTTDLVERNFFWHHFNLWTLKKNHLCVAVSKSVRDLILEKTNLAPNQIQVIYPGIDLSRFPRDPVSRIKNQYRSPIIGTVSRLSPEKGIDILIQSFARIHRELPMAQLHIVGYGKEDSVLRKISQSLGLKDQVFWHGYQKNILPFLNTFDCYVQPSRNESFGLTVLEAMASGVPIIASQVGGLSEIVQHGKNGFLVPPGDSEALAGGILELLSNPERMKSFVLSAYEGLKRYHLSSVIQQYAQMYHRIL